MSELSFVALELSIAALEQGLAEHAQYPQLTTVRDGVIQRFEVTLDISQKLMKRVLQETYNMEPARIAKNTAREAAGMGLIADAEAWIGHIDARNATAHTYDSAKAAQVFNRIPVFLSDARDLLARLKNAVA
ncbi:MAG: nucleotidyltransferase substrate binding protein [Pseudomonadota bacterium]